MQLSQNGGDYGYAVGYVLTYVLPGFVSVVIFQSACLEGYKEFRHISRVCRINYHGQSCQKQRTNPEELEMTHCLFQRL